MLEICLQHGFKASLCYVKRQDAIMDNEVVILSDRAFNELILFGQWMGNIN